MFRLRRRLHHDEIGRVFSQYGDILEVCVEKKNKNLNFRKNKQFFSSFVRYRFEIEKVR